MCALPSNSYAITERPGEDGIPAEVYMTRHAMIDVTGNCVYSTDWNGSIINSLSAFHEQNTQLIQLLRCTTFFAKEGVFIRVITKKQFVKWGIIVDAVKREIKFTGIVDCSFQGTPTLQWNAVLLSKVHLQRVDNKLLTPTYIQVGTLSSQVLNMRSPKMSVYVLRHVLPRPNDSIPLINEA